MHYKYEDVRGTLFSPGPWSYRGSLGPQSNPYLKGPHVIESATGAQIAILNGWRSEVSEANARLISRAPTLYECAMAVVQAWHDHTGAEPSESVLARAIAELTEELEKAKGQP